MPRVVGDDESSSDRPVNRVRPFLDGPTARQVGRKAKWPCQPDDAASSPPGGVSGPPAGLPAPSRPDQPHARPAPAVREPVPWLDPAERERVIDLIAKGMSRSMACRDLGVTLKAPCGEVVSDPSYRAAIKVAEDARAGDVELVLYEAGLGGNVAAAVAYLKAQRDKDLLREAERQGRAALANQTKIADAYAGQAGIDTNVFTDDELQRFAELQTRLSRGEPLDSVEASEYVEAMRRAYGGYGNDS